MTSSGVSFSRFVTSIIHLRQNYKSSSSSTVLTQKSISAKSFFTFILIPFKFAQTSAFADTKPNKISSHILLLLALSKRNTNAPPCLLEGSSHTGLTFRLKRQIYEPTGRLVGRLKCWQQAQNCSTVSMFATGWRLSSKLSSPFTKCWYQKVSLQDSGRGWLVFSIISRPINYGIK